MRKYPNIESFDPRECLSGRISRIHRLTATIFRKYIAPFDVTNSQLTLLFILSKNAGLTQKQLSDIAKLEKSSLHRNLKRLLDQEYLNKSKERVIKYLIIIGLLLAVFFIFGLLGNIMVFVRGGFKLRGVECYSVDTI